MLKSSGRSAIHLRGVRHNNLKNFDLDLPLNQLIVITGLSGSGKSSLAFDTLFAEGQRRYIETFSPYARQFFDRMDKPQVDSIEGIPPAIAIEQRNAVRTTRSTVGTMTEICDYMKMLWPHVARLHCRQCSQPVLKDSPQAVWEAVRSELGSAASTTRPRDNGCGTAGTGNGTAAPEVLVTFDLPLAERLSVKESLELVSKQGYQRLLLEGRMARLDDLLSGNASVTQDLSRLTVIQDRVKLEESSRARFVEACEQAYHFGKGKLALYRLDSSGKVIGRVVRFSKGLHCARCDIEYREPSPALFSFNHPVGACPTCRGFGRVISIDYDLAVPDRTRTLAEGVVKPWQTGLGAECQTDLMRMCRRHGIPTDVPFQELPKKWRDFVIEGEPGYGKDEAHQWPSAWYGVKGYFRWLESKAYKMHVRVLLSRYRAYTPCPDCRGKRFQPESMLYRLDEGEEPGTRGEGGTTRSRKEQRSNPAAEGPGGRLPIAGGQQLQAATSVRAPLTLADFYQLPIRDALELTNELAQRGRFRPNQPIGLVLQEVRSRLGYLNEVGLGYLTLDRPTRSLSGGETERVNLTTCLGTRLVNTLFVLDEPSVGLHPRDTQRLVRILEQLRDAGNTVLVVEHEASVMRAADEIIDLGPGHGATGGQVVFQGTFSEILTSKSLTGQYLSGRKQIELPERRPVRMAGAGSRPGLARNAGARRKAESTSSAVRFREVATPFRPSAAAGPVLKLSRATRHNLNDVSVNIPLGRFVCVTGVSGSGKTTLIRELLLPALSERLRCELPGAKASDRLAEEGNGENGNDEERFDGRAGGVQIEGAERLGRVILVDQSILGKTPRSNPAVYIGAFDDIREFFAQSEAARQRGLNASAFSFNSSQGQCQRCRGAGFEKIEMQFLSDVFIRCPDCGGRRYRDHILEIKLAPESKGLRLISIADVLESTVEEAITFLEAFPDSRPAQRALTSLRLLAEVGLGYLALGQPINTLSGGESQRLKLVRHLAEAFAGTPSTETPPSRPRRSAGFSLRGSVSSERQRDSHLSLPNAQKPTLFLFDEPTTGLHFEDVRVLLRVFQRLVDAGHSVVVIEHNLDVIKSADWLIDLGPEAGDEGGRVVVEGTPEQVAANEASHTGQALREVLAPARTL